MLAQLYPPLHQFWPNLQTVSAPQTAFLLLDCLEALYGGAAGGGKSDALLSGAFQYADHPGYAALILRRTFADLALPGAAMSRSHEWLHGLAHWNGNDKTWSFPSGASLTFGYLEHENDIYRYQSSEFQYIGFDELTQFTRKQYVYMFSRLRRRTGLNVPLRMRAATNPGGVGHGWVLPRFPIKPGLTPEDCDGRIFVPARLSDNPGLRADEYAGSLRELDEVTRQQLLDGDWGVFEGAAFTLRPDSLIDRDIEIPDGWERFESMDFGVTNPTCVLAWAADYDGNLIVFDSYYQAGRLVSDHAAALEGKREQWWPAGSHPICHADPSMWAKKGGVSRMGDPATDVTEFRDHGITGLIQANNHRRPGRVRLTELLKPDDERIFPGWHPRAGETGAPRLFVLADRCPELVEQLQAAPLLPTDSGKEGAGEIVDPSWESSYGHAVAAARYGSMTWKRPSVETRTPDFLAPPDPPEQLRARRMRKVEEKRNKTAGGKRYRLT